MIVSSVAVIVGMGVSDDNAGTVFVGVGVTEGLGLGVIVVVGSGVVVDTKTGDGLGRVHIPRVLLV